MKKNNNNFQKAAGITSGITGVISSTLNNLTPDATTDTTLNNQTNAIKSTLSKTSLSNWVSDWVPQAEESMGLAGLSGAVSGAAAGASAGPWGAVGGAIVGLGTSLFGAVNRNKKREEANDRINTMLQAQNKLLSQKEAQDALANIAAFGGWVETHGGNFPTGFDVFNTGGLHESNPYNGILQGIDQNGMPNLVEEGETKWNNYIFSNRLKIPKEFKDSFKLGNIKNKTYADASKKIVKESEERPFDTISLRGRDAMLNRLREAQETQKFINEADNTMNKLFSLHDLDDVIYAEGGNIHIAPSKRGTFTAAAKKYGKSVQEFARQVLANKENYSSAMVKKANFARNAAKWHADGGPLQDSWMNNIPNTSYFAGSYGDNIGPKVTYNPISKPTFNVNTQLTTDNVINKSIYDNIITSPIKINQLAKNNDNIKSNITNFKPITISTDTTNSTSSDKFNWGLFAPALANTGIAIADLFSQPEKVQYGRMDLSDYMIRRKLPYEPIDREYLANKYRAQANATAKQIIDNSAGNPASARASLVAHNNNVLNALGDLYFKADEINRQRKKESIMFDATQDRQLASLDMNQQQFNIGIDAREQQVNAQNRAAARNAIRSGVLNIGQTIGEAARYLEDINKVSKMFPLYSYQGNYTGYKNGGFLFDKEVEKFLKQVKKGGK